MRIGVLHINRSQSSSKMSGSEIAGIYDVLRSVTRRAEHHQTSSEINFVFATNKRRATQVGRAVLDGVHKLGHHTSVGIADDRLTAHLAATGQLPELTKGKQSQLLLPDVTVVPIGGSHVRLKNLPVEQLRLPETPTLALKAMGVKTIGQFSNLPLPTTTRNASLEAVLRKAQRIARGEDVVTSKVPLPDKIVESWNGTQAVNLKEVSSDVYQRVVFRLKLRGETLVRCHLVAHTNLGRIDHLGKPHELGPLLSSKVTRCELTVEESAVDAGSMNSIGFLPPANTSREKSRQQLLIL